MDVFGVEHLGVFIVSGWLLNLTPGPDVLCVIRHALHKGVRAGIVAALGISTGCIVHIVVAALGLSALMAASSTAFGILKWVGAAYLFYVGVRLLRSAPAPAMILSESDAIVRGDEQVQPSVFWNGFLTNVLNPKVALFFLAFMPQFIVPNAEYKSASFVFLGVLFAINALPVTMGYAVLAAWASQRMKAVQRGMHVLDRLAGILFVGFGVKLAFTDATPA